MSLDVYPVTPVTAQCIYAAAAEQRLPVEILVAILVAEGGRPGIVSRNKNGTVDLGPMQVNSIHVPSASSAQHKFSALKNDGCYNVRYGAYRLRAEIDRVDDFWIGVGNYHSRTPHLHQKYVSQHVIPALTKTRPYATALRNVFTPKDSK